MNEVAIKKMLNRAICILILAIATRMACSAALAQGCVETAEAYRRAWESCTPIACVSPKLYSTIAVGSPGDVKTPYPKGFHWAWSNGFENLEKYAQWRLKQCRQPASGGTVTRDILLYVGFSPQSIVAGQVYTLLVMDLSQDASLFVPSIEGWAKAFQSAFDLKLPLETQKRLTLNLSGSQLNESRPAIPVSPTSNFSRITGCSAVSAALCSDAPLTLCQPDYRMAADAIKAFLPYNPSPNATTRNCVDAFKRYVGGRAATPAEARALLVYCQDVNPCNSGLGLGFNPSYPGPYGVLLQHFTGREYVFLNQPVEALKAAKIALPPPSGPSNNNPPRGSRIDVE